MLSCKHFFQADAITTIFYSMCSTWKDGSQMITSRQPYGSVPIALVSHNVFPDDQKPACCCALYKSQRGTPKRPDNFPASALKAARARPLGRVGHLPRPRHPPLRLALSSEDVTSSLFFDQPRTHLLVLTDLVLQPRCLLVLLHSASTISRVRECFFCRPGISLSHFAPEEEHDLPQISPSLDLIGFSPSGVIGTGWLG